MQSTERKRHSSNPPAPAPDARRGARAGMELLQTLLADYRPRNFALRLWDGSQWQAEGKPRFALELRCPAALRHLFLAPTELKLGEAFIHGDIDVEGDLEAALPLAQHLMQRARALGWRDKLRCGRLLLSLPGGHGGQRAQLRGAPHSPGRDAQAIAYHYDISNEFYALWLDRHMVYSCAYFNSPDDDIDAAQERKLDYICRKLRLRPGEKLLDIGCGWGGLALHAAGRYGAEVVGITLSRKQLEWARRRIAAAGLQDRCRIELCDYRQVEGRFDKVVSVGMFEHVGRERLPAYFARAYDLLRPGGVFLNHGIATRRGQALPRRASFIHHYVFPDGELTEISASLQAAEISGFEVRDVESLREHYALTLRRWLRRLEARRQQALQYVGETTYRIWRLYMAGSAHAFASGRNNLYQALLLRPDEAGRSGLPLTRADWYE